jgi:murein DD-endopeptidase MepM/ murein hydrolase activator NlpD
MQAFVHKLRFPFVAMLVIANLFLLTLVPSVVQSSKKNAQQPQQAAQSSYLSDDANVVTSGMLAMANAAGRATGSFRQTTSNVLSDIGGTVGGAAKKSGTFVGSSLQTVGNAIVYGSANSFAFVGRVPGNIFGLITNGAMASSVVRPSSVATIPVITSADALLPAAAQTATAASAIPESPPATSDAVVAAWPLHGTVTTLFGESDWPYQPVHTGIDISDGTRPGTTPVRPYRPGKVVQVISANYGLGNHVVVDHGSGVTSVYAHLNSISVTMGQDVNQSTIIGMEGTTGASTGTHLHFEIRVNGQPVNPRLYISGHP